MLWGGSTELTYRMLLLPGGTPGLHVARLDAGIYQRPSFRAAGSRRHIDLHGRKYP
jgi:hypothetical protein